MKKYLPFFIAGATPGILLFAFCFIVAAIGKVVCFVRPEWWLKVFGGG